jgi:hypothetical protein
MTRTPPPRDSASPGFQASGPPSPLVAGSPVLSWVRRIPPWPTLFACLGVAGLLALFQIVVEAAVRQGDERKAAMAEQALAVWTCKGLTGVAQQEHCMAQVRALKAAAEAAASAGGR